MRYQDVHIQIQLSGEALDLPVEVEQLASAARQATGRAYAPYSHFQVGAAVLLANGETVTGNNQENAAYPSGLCAERVALYYANSRFPGVAIRHLVVAARTSGGEVQSPISPCGACRQVMLETETRQSEPMQVWLLGAEKVYRLPSSATMLPFAFTAADLAGN